MRMKQLKQAINVKDFVVRSKSSNENLVQDLNVQSQKNHYTGFRNVSDPYMPPRCRNMDIEHTCHKNSLPKRVKLSKLQKQIFKAAELNDVIFLKSNICMTTDNDLNCQNQVGNTPLYVAVSNNNLPTAKYLINVGAKVNGRNINGNTVLHKAIILSDFRMILFLIQMGADVNIKNE